MNELKRVNPIEFRALEDTKGMVLQGYAIVFNQPTVLAEVDGIQYREVISPTALNQTPLNDVYLKFNHQNNTTPLARTKGGSLQLTIDQRGLFFIANLFDTQQARDVYNLVKAGGLDKCSFGFQIAKGGDTYDKKSHTRTINKISTLYEISIVENPAYPQTEVEARDYFKAQQDLEDLKARLILQTYL